MYVFVSSSQGVIIAILVFTGVLSGWFGEGNYVPQRIQASSRNYFPYNLVI